MADADEDAIRDPRKQTSADSSDDEDDAPQDFRFLSMLTLSRASASLPKRGMKDFEPDPTRLQSSTLAASRQAMHDALSHTRIHAPKAHVVGLYNKRTGMTRVKKAKGSMFKSIGQGLRDGSVELLPEEALWALERGSLDVKWPIVDEAQNELDVKNGEDEKLLNDIEPDVVDAQDDQEEEDTGIPMSLQGAYAAFLGDEEVRGGSLTLDRYLVYAGLKRSGYIVLRAEGFGGRPTGRNGVPLNISSQERGSGLFTWLYKLAWTSWSSQSDFERQRAGPLVTAGLYRSYDEIYRILSIIPSGHSFNHYCASSITGTVSSTLPFAQHPFTTTFNVHKPLPNYRKTAPGIPSFRVCVVSARDTLVPTLSELIDLLNEQVSQEKVKGDASEQTSVPAMYKHLKQDGRNVVLAVVDEGVISYIKASEAAFSEEKVYERVGKGGKRGGGSGGTRGRGGGRGGRSDRGGRGR